MKAALWFLVAVLSITTSPVLSAERPTPEELLAAYQKSVEKLARVRIEHVEKHPESNLEQIRVGTKNDQKTTPSVKKVSVAMTDERTVVRDRSRWNIINVSRVTNIPDGTQNQRSRRFESIVGDQVRSLQSSQQGLFLTAWLDRDRATKTEQPGGQDDPNRMVWKMLGGAKFLFGRLSGDADEPIWDVMREASTLELLPETEEVGGVQTHVLNSHGKYGEHTVWLDSKSGGLPRRIEIRKQLGNLYDDNQLGVLAGQSGDEPRRIVKVGSGNGITGIFQKPDIREFSLRIDKIELENKNGVFVMTSWNSEENTTTGNAKTERRVRSEHSVPSVNFGPEAVKEDAFRFHADIPNKTRVIVMDGGPGAEYEWIDGEIKVSTRK